MSGIMGNRCICRIVNRPTVFVCSTTVAQASNLTAAPRQFAAVPLRLASWSLGGYEFGLEIESVLGKFEKTIYNDI